MQHQQKVDKDIANIWFQQKPVVQGSPPFRACPRSGGPQIKVDKSVFCPAIFHQANTFLQTLAAGNGGISNRGRFGHRAEDNCDGFWLMSNSRRLIFSDSMPTIQSPGSARSRETPPASCDPPIWSLNMPPIVALSVGTADVQPNDRSNFNPTRDVSCDAFMTLMA
jgi:hypothetical protein